MANLTAVFELVDRISDKLDAIANRGSTVIDSWENAGNALDEAFDGAISATSSVVSAIDNYSRATGDAALQTDFWTNAVGSYDKSALEALYSTEELVNMGMKSADALEYEADIMAQCDKAAQELSQALDSAAKIQEDCAAAMEEASKSAESVAENDRVSAQTKDELKTATENATQAYNELMSAQNEAQAAMENYDAVLSSGTASLDETQAAAERAAQASDNLVVANEKVANATDELSKATEKASEEADSGGKSGVEAIQSIEAALASAGIIKTLDEIVEGAYELVTAFSEAESTVILATGATGNALDGLSDSMMKAYAASKTGSLDDTAAAVGEINTRLAYTGDKLAETTVMFLDFAAVTGGNAAKSVRNLTQLMNQWDISADSLSVIMDKLTYAGQASGIGVDGLSSQLINNKAVLDQLGFSMDEAIAMFMNFELAGTNVTQVMTGFRRALSSGAISSLDEFYDILDKITAGEIDAADAADIFGSRAGPAIVNAANSGVFALEDVVGALEASEGVMETTAEAAQTLDQKWEQATNNINSAFTEAVEPTIDGLSSRIADVVNNMGTFLNEHPNVVKAITSIGTGIGVVAAGIAGVAVVTKVVIPLMATLTASMGPLGIALAAVSAALVGVVSYIGLSNDGTSEMCVRVDELSDRVNSLHSETQSLLDTYNQVEDGFSNQIGSAHVLADELEEIASSSQTAAQKEALMEPIVARLNELYPSLGLNVSNVAERLDGLSDAIDTASNSSGLQEKYQAAKDSLADLLVQEEELAKVADEAEQAYEDAYFSERSFAEATLDYSFLGSIFGSSNYTKALEKASDARSTAISDLQAVRNAIAECEDIITKYGDTVEGVSDETISSYDAAAIAIENVKDASAELISNYNESYEAAYDSISGQIGLFDQMAISCETSTDQMIAALKSQTDYLATYTENLKAAADFGFTDGLISSLSDGSEESAGYLEAIISKVEELGGTTDEAKAFIDEMNGSFAEVETAKEDFANTVAEMETDFSTKMDELQANLDKAVTKMTKDEEAAEAAKQTIEAYISMIESYKGKAGEAAEQVAEATTIALMGALTNLSSSEVPVPDFSNITYGPQLPPAGLAVPAHASGTTNAEDVFIAGEQGPELIVGAAGGTVFPNTETERIVDAVSEYSYSYDYSRTINSPDNFYVPVGDNDRGAESTSGGSRDKKITLEIAGKGNIELSGGKPDKESMLAFLYEYMKPVLSEILSQEIYEEGDLSYDY